MPGSPMPCGPVRAFGPIPPTADAAGPSRSRSRGRLRRPQGRGLLRRMNFSDKMLVTSYNSEQIFYSSYYCNYYLRQRTLPILS